MIPPSYLGGPCSPPGPDGAAFRVWVYWSMCVCTGAVWVREGAVEGEGGAASGRAREERAGRGPELSGPLREMPQTYFSLWCLGS